MTDTNPPPAANPDSNENEIERVSAFIVAARRMLSENKIVDLAPIERKVEALCWKIRDISPDHRTPVLLALENMIDNLDHLALELTEQNCLIAAGFENTSPLRVLAAYSKPGDGS